jgi:hypothetical protein
MNFFGLICNARGALARAVGALANVSSYLADALLTPLPRSLSPIAGEREDAPGGGTRPTNAAAAAAAAKREAEALAVMCAANPRTIGAAPRRERRRFENAVRVLAASKPWLVSNYYESGNPWSDGSRSQVYDYAKDARYDQNQVTRRTLEYRVRHWEQNSGFAKRVLSVKKQYIIGTHMPVVTSMSSNPEWSAMAEKVFHEMCESAGLQGESMFALMDVAFGRKCVDGNCLTIETSKPGKMTIRRGTKYETQLDVLRPCFQNVESQRIGNSLGMWFQDLENVIDGVQYKEVETKLPDGRSRKQLVRAGYWINDTTTALPDNEGFVFVPEERSFYWTSAHRVNEPRGISDFYAIEPTLALLEDLQKLEMRAQEVQSDLTVFITNGAGQLVDDRMQATLGALKIKLSADATGKPQVTAKDVERVKELYQKIYGGRQVAGRTGDTLEFLAPNRPAEATLNLWNHLIDLLCAGSDVPRVLIFPKTQKGQGTEVRAEIEVFNGAARKEFNLLPKPFIHRAWRYFMKWAIANDERVKNAPSDWEVIEVSPPRSVVVDLGYDSGNKLSEMAAGVYPLHQWAQDHGTTKNRIIQQSVADIFDIKLACAKLAELPEYKKYDLTVDAAEVRQDLGDVIKSLAAQTTSEAVKETADVAHQSE